MFFAAAEAPALAIFGRQLLLGAAHLPLRWHLSLCAATSDIS
jgi:hypothetical protein